jgi:CHAT domain-containing protein/tetratricopeptide (TPR) repeat protein
MACGRIAEGGEFLARIWHEARKRTGAGSDTAVEVGLAVLEHASPFCHDELDAAVRQALADWTANGKPEKHWRLLRAICLYGLNRGDYPTAKQAAVELLGLFESAASLEPDGMAHQHAEAVANLATVEEASGHAEAARRTLDDALSRLRKNRQTNRAAEAVLLWKYGEMLEGRCEWSEAERYMRDALQIAGGDSLAPAILQSVLAGLGLVRERVGDYEEAISLYQRAVSHARKQFPDKPIHVANAINNLALALTATGRTAEAERLWEESLAILRMLRPLPWEELASQLSNFGIIKFNTGNDPSQAADMFREALDLTGSDEAPLVADRLCFALNLAAARERLGDHTSAHDIYARCVASLFKERARSSDVTTSVALAGLGRTKLKLGRRQEALECARQALDVSMAALEEVFTFTSERERLQYEPTLPIALLADLGDDTLLAEAMLRSKGIVLDSVLADTRAIRAATSNPATRKLLGSVTLLRREQERLAILLGPEKQKPPRLLEVESALRDAEAGMARMASKTHEALRLRVADVTERMPADTMLLDFLRTEKDYGVCAWSPGKPPRWIKLGTCASIDHKIAELRRVLAGSGTTPGDAGPLNDLLRDAFDTLLKPALGEAASCKRLFISPDGMLHQIPFAVLLDEQDRALVETRDLALVSSARDLLKPYADLTGTDALIICDPQFENVPAPAAGSKETPETQHETTGMAPLPVRVTARGELQLQSLPGTAREGRAIGDILRDNEWSVSTLGQGAATEAAWYAAKPASILHIATHGIILDSPVGSGITGTLVDRAKPAGPSPLELGMLALTGAQATLNAWRAGQTPPTMNDGWLLASEIADQTLAETSLVVLSACDTGLGNIWTGEGVVGLKRAFFVAGAQNVIATLWSIPDAETADFMQAFYRTLTSCRNPRQAVNETQRTFFRRWRSQGGLRHAVASAGAFTLDVQGLP